MSLSRACRASGSASSFAKPGAVPFLIRHILDHGHDRNVGLGILNVFQDPIIDAGLQVHGRPRETEPTGDHPIETRQRPLESRIAILIPVDVKADAQRPSGGACERGGHDRPLRHGGLRSMRQIPLSVAQFGGQSCRASERLGIGGICDRDAMRRRAGRRPGAADRHVRVGGGFLGDGSMHDQERRDEQRHDDPADRADQPGEPDERAAALARRIEEYWLTGHSELVISESLRESVSFAR